MDKRSKREASEESESGSDRKAPALVERKKRRESSEESYDRRARKPGPKSATKKGRSSSEEAYQKQRRKANVRASRKGRDSSEESVEERSKVKSKVESKKRRESSSEESPPRWKASERKSRRDESSDDESVKRGKKKRREESADSVQPKKKQKTPLMNGKDKRARREETPEEEEERSNKTRARIIASNKKHLESSDKESTQERFKNKKKSDRKSVSADYSEVKVEREEDDEPKKKSVTKKRKSTRPPTPEQSEEEEEPRPKSPIILQPFPDLDDYTGVKPDAYQVNENGEKQWVVEAILDKRTEYVKGKNGKNKPNVYYEVKWLGWDHCDNTWQKRNEGLQCDDLIDEFEVKWRRKQQEMKKKRKPGSNAGRKTSKDSKTKRESEKKGKRTPKNSKKSTKDQTSEDDDEDNWDVVEKEITPEKSITKRPGPKSKTLPLSPIKVTESAKKTGGKYKGEPEVKKKGETKPKIQIKIKPGPKSSKINKEPANNGRSGSERSLRPYKIYGAIVNGMGEVMYLVQWSKSAYRDIVLSSNIRDDFPQLIIDYYESKTSWPQSGNYMKTQYFISPPTSTVVV